MKIRRLHKDESGATIVIVSLSITVIIMICSLALDFGIVYFNESKAQNALDAAMLAAGQYLPVDETDTVAKENIESVVRNYLTKNGIVDLSTLNINLSNIRKNHYNRIDADLGVNSELNFARIIGVHSINVTKSAGAELLPAVRLSDAVPLAVKKTNLDYCIANGLLTNITLKYGGGGGTEGDFGALDLDGVKGGGSSDYEKWLTYGYTPELVIGEGLIPVEPGNMTGATSTAFNARYNACTHFQGSGGCNREHYVPSCTRVVKTPVVEYVGDKAVKIVAFAAFVLDSPANTSSGYITGSFISAILPSTPAERIEDINNADYGVYSLKLSK